MPHRVLQVPTTHGETRDSQGYEPHQLVCHQCLRDIRYEAYQLEDEDLYHLEQFYDSTR